jgi:hypothetical protein
VYTLIGMAFVVLIGAMLRVQGLSALLWTPLGFAFGFFSAGQIVLPVLLGLPRAIWLVSKAQMRLSVCLRILVVSFIWLVMLAVLLVLIGYFWPSTAESAYNNLALNLGMSLGMLAILLCPLSARCRSDFVADFNTSYQKFFTELGKAMEPGGGQPTPQSLKEWAAEMKAKGAGTFRLAKPGKPQ